MSEEIPFERTTLTGLKYYITQAGHGKNKPVKGEMVKVHYTGRFEDGEVFDTSQPTHAHPSSGTREPFEFKVGMGQVIAGWDEAIGDMVVGEKRTLTIPPNLGYGENPPPSIRRNAVLIFDVERMA